jgi:hypothetical protein
VQVVVCCTWLALLQGCSKGWSQLLARLGVLGQLLLQQRYTHSWPQHGLLVQQWWALVQQLW